MQKCSSLLPNSQLHPLIISQQLRDVLVRSCSIFSPRSQTDLTPSLPPEMAFPGLALPEAFESLDSHLESVVSLCQLKGSTEAQAVGVVSICQELLRLLKCAFIGELRVKIRSMLVT